MLKLKMMSLATIFALVVSVVLTSPAHACMISNASVCYNIGIYHIPKLKNSKQNHPIIYKVKAGDTLYQIANQFDTTVEMLMIENQVNDPTLLQIGTELKIPAQQTDLSAYLNVEKQGNIKEVITATLTAYTAGVESTGKTPDDPAYGITSSGKKAKEGRTIAVDPNVIPIGTQVYIEGIGVRTAEDTGSAIKGAKIDVFMNDVNEALEFGVKKNVKVYVMESTA